MLESILGVEPIQLQQNESWGTDILEPWEIRYFISNESKNKFKPQHPQMMRSSIFPLGKANFKQKILG